METEQKIPTQLIELNKYIDSLFDRVEERMRRCTLFLKIEVAALIAMLAGLLIHPIVHEVLWVTWFAIFVYRAVFLMPQVNKLQGEIEGVFKTLEILGMIDKSPFGNKRKKRTLADLFAPLVRAWQTTKEKAQKELWGEGVVAPMPVAARTQ